MCTTALLISTLVVMLRRRFFNKVEPYVLPLPRLLGDPPKIWGRRTEGGPQGWGGGVPLAQPVLGGVWFASGFCASGGNRQCAPVPGVVGCNFSSSKEETWAESCPFVGHFAWGGNHAVLSGTGT